jgi:hypothetical protein
MNEKDRQEKIEFLKKRLKSKFEKLAVPMNQIDYTYENYDRFFPNSEISTPIGKIALRNDQFKKLKRKGRQNLLGAMHQTLTDPIAIINEDREGGKAKLFSKSFLKNNKPIVSVVIYEKGKNTAISTHDRRLNNILNKIKDPTDLLYEKQTNGDVGPAGDDSYSLNLAISGDTQSVSDISQTITNVKDKNKFIV